MYYLKKKDSGKAYKGGKSLMESGHVVNVMSSMLSPNIRYCFYVVNVILNKNCPTILTMFGCVYIKTWAK